MDIGILKEIKTQESRVSMTPSGVEVLIRAGHQVYVEKNAGVNSGFLDESYMELGAKIIANPKLIYDNCQMVMHVKEPQPDEFHLIHKDQIIFTYLHLAASRTLTEALLKTEAIGIAYETVETEENELPLLIPMSEVAGRMAAQEGAKYLERTFGGRGILMGGVPGTPPAKVIVIGGGIVGYNAALIASGMGADVTILDMNLNRLRYLSQVMPRNCKMLMSSPALLRELVKDADLIIGSVLVHGAKAPKLITKEMLSTMKKGTVLVDVAIDQGGCFETSRATTHNDPIFEVDGIIHYCVTNMPGAVPLTSTIALTNATLPYALQLANKGWIQACSDNKALRNGVNFVQGKITCHQVAKAFDLEYIPITEFLKK